MARFFGPASAAAGFSAWKVETGLGYFLVFLFSLVLASSGIFALHPASDSHHSHSPSPALRTALHRKANGDDPSPARRGGGAGEAEQYQDVRRAQPPFPPPERHPGLRHDLLHLSPPISGVQPPRARYDLTHRNVLVFPGRNLMAGVVLLQVLYWLSGLTCTDENFIIKSGAQRAAAAHGIALVAPDTSPRMLILNPAECCGCLLFLGFVSARGRVSDCGGC